MQFVILIKSKMLYKTKDVFLSQMSADLKSMEDDKNRVFAKLTDEMKAKEDLQGRQID